MEIEGWAKVGKYRYKKDNLRVYGEKRNNKRKKPRWYWEVRYDSPVVYQHCGSATSREVAMERAELVNITNELDKGE